MIDVKTLTIGSHVEYDGKRIKVVLVRDDGCICEYKDNGQDVVVGLGIEKKPIPITPELLTELGFKKEDGFMRLWNKDDNGHFSYIEFSAIGDKWRLYPSSTDGSSIVVRYLHEAEAFLALHGVELIEE